MLQSGESRKIDGLQTEMDKSINILQTIKGIRWHIVLLCLIGFFMGRIEVFNTFYTIAIAYIGIMFFDIYTMRIGALFTIAGIVSTGVLDQNLLFNEPLIKATLISLLISGIRRLMLLNKVKLNFKNQLVIVALSLFIINMVSLVLVRFTFYKMIIALLEGVVALALMELLYVPVSYIYQKKKNVLTEYELVGMAFFIGCMIYGMVDINVVVPFFDKVYLKDSLVFLLLIVVTNLSGIGGGIIASIVVSSVLVVLGYMPTHFVAIYVFTVLIGGIFSKLDRLGIVFSMLFGLLLAFALFNNCVIDEPIMGAYIIAAFISLILPRHYFGLAKWFNEVCKEETLLIDRQSFVTQTLENFSNQFQSISKKFDKIPSFNTALDINGMNTIIEDTRDSVCSKCSMYDFCWKDYRGTSYECSYSMLKILEKTGQIVTKNIPEQFRKACINSESFAYTLSMKYDIYLERCKCKSRFHEVRLLFSEEFRGVSESIKELAHTINCNFTYNKENEMRLKEELYRKGIKVRDIMVIEKERHLYEVHINCYCKEVYNYKEWLLSKVQAILNMQLETVHYRFDEKQNAGYFVYRVRKTYNIVAKAKSQAISNVSGDSYSFRELQNGLYLMALTDGMGHGREAEKMSREAIELLENFLEAGFTVEAAMRMINSTLVLKSEDETYTTMDIALINQYTGVAEFVKMGATTSFILRGKEVILVKGGSLPIGILSNVDLVSFKKQLKSGDILIMVTDGMLEGNGDLTTGEDTFKAFIMEAENNNPDYIVDFLFDKALNLLAGEVKDDMTIAALRIWK